MFQILYPVLGVVIWKLTNTNCYEYVLYPYNGAGLSDVRRIGAKDYAKLFLGPINPTTLSVLVRWMACQSVNGKVLNIQNIYSVSSYCWAVRTKSRFFSTTVLLGIKNNGTWDCSLTRTRRKSRGSQRGRNVCDLVVLRAMFMPWLWNRVIQETAQRGQYIYHDARLRQTKTAAKKRFLLVSYIPAQHEARVFGRLDAFERISL